MLIGLSFILCSKNYKLQSFCIYIPKKTTRDSIGITKIADSIMMGFYGDYEKIKMSFMGITKKIDKLVEDSEFFYRGVHGILRDSGQKKKRFWAYLQP